MEKDELIDLEYQKMLGGNDKIALDFSHHKSLINLYKKFSPETTGPKILELGAGPCSLFYNENNADAKIIAVEKNLLAHNYAKENYSASNIEYILGDISNLKDWSESFDVIIDAHCLHLFTDPIERRKIFQTLSDRLTDDGAIYAEMMISSSRMRFVEPFSYSDIGGTLFYKDIPYAYIPDCRKLEDEILSYGLKIFYFYVINGRKFFIDKRTFSDPNIGNCDCVQVVIKKA